MCITYFLIPVSTLIIGKSSIGKVFGIYRQFTGSKVDTCKTNDFQRYFYQQCIFYLLQSIFYKMIFLYELPFFCPFGSNVLPIIYRTHPTYYVVLQYCVWYCMKYCMQYLLSRHLQGHKLFPQGEKLFPRKPQKSKKSKSRGQKKGSKFIKKGHLNPYTL